MDQDDRDMLIRIDENMKSIKEMLFDKPSYPTIKGKVIAHSRLLWLTLTASILAVVKSFWSN